MFIVPQLLQDPSCCDGDLGGVLPGMVRVAQGTQDLVPLFQIDIDFFGMGYGFVSEFFHTEGRGLCPVHLLCQSLRMASKARGDRSHSVGSMAT